MRQRRLSQLPQPRTVRKIKFENKVECSLHMLMSGVDEKEASPEQKKQFEIPDCVHRIWPPLSPQCLLCLSKNKYEEFMVTKNGKGKELRIVK